jgi:hypothetical protein
VEHAPRRLQDRRRRLEAQKGGAIDFILGGRGEPNQKRVKIIGYGCSPISCGWSRRYGRHRRQHRREASIVLRSIKNQGRGASGMSPAWVHGCWMSDLGGMRTLKRPREATCIGLLRRYRNLILELYMPLACRIFLINVSVG